MSTSLSSPPARGHPSTGGRGQRGWFGQLLRRLHFYAGVLVGPFILVAALSGALYALTPQLEQAIYQRELQVPVSEVQLTLAEQIEIAQAHVDGEGATLSAVRPAPEPGGTTRVMFAEEGLGPSESRAVFVDPGTGEVRGDLTVYGTSGALPVRTWINNLHRGLHLGDVGRVYSELAASWLAVVVLAGLGLWVARVRRSRSKRDFLVPNVRRTGQRRLLSWHASLGVWVLLGALFLSATGITWSQFGGASVSSMRSALGWETPTLTTSLDGDRDDAGEHDHHHHHGVVTAPTGDANPATFDAVLAIAQRVNVNTGLVEIQPPAEPGTAWVVQEIQRSYPTEVDAVAIDGTTMEVVDRVDFDDYPLAAKLSRWGVDLHMGTLFGLPNQVLLVGVAGGIAVMVVLGYAMWWKRRPTREPGAFGGRPPGRGGFRRAPWWGVAAVLAVAGLVGWWLPLLGISLAAFLALDLVLGAVARRRERDRAGHAG
ncbi:PepSY-associated TM helix domain-containing protein [Actinoalloteichus spitiensis]|uniref:PepSY-associated TM helix domain-containing protein n=1 Tax=Actinoalloteichus spitiensis TaxID=252394 RepID=UPI00037D5A42|nr:PepSY domain-containing protein [Actinoalloteichus spitiensis]